MFRTARRLATLLPVFLLCACYSLSSSGGFPEHIRTIFIAPLDNKTVRFELDAQLQRELTEKLPRALGVRQGGEKVADAVIRGEITRYDDQATNYQQGNAGNVAVISHQVTITVTIRVIDVKNNRYLYEGVGITGRGEYRPDTESDEGARTRAIQNLIQQIIDGAQAQW